MRILCNDVDMSFRTYLLDTAVTDTLRLKAMDANGKSIPVRWHSSDRELALIDQNGIVQASEEKTGVVLLSCTTLDEPTFSCNLRLKLTKKVHTISLSHYDAYSIRSESIVTLSPRFINPAGEEYSPSDPQLCWEVVEGKQFAYFSNPSVGTLCTGPVSQTERVKILLSSGNNPKSTAELYVDINPMVQKLTIFHAGEEVTGAKLQAKLSTPLRLRAVCFPAQSTAELNWSSSSSNVTVKDGIVTAKAPGSAIITVSTADGIGASASVTVNFS